MGTITPFANGTGEIIRVFETLESSVSTPEEKIQFVINAFREIRNMFAAPKTANPAKADLNFKLVTNCCDKLSAMRALISNPEAPKDENTKRFELEIRKIQQAVVSGYFKALSEKLYNMLQDLRNSSRMTSHTLKKNMSIYLSENRSIDDFLNTQDEIEELLKEHKVDLFFPSHQTEKILRTMKLETLDRSFVSPLDYKPIFSLIREFQSEYSAQTALAVAERKKVLRLADLLDPETSLHPKIAIETIHSNQDPLAVFEIYDRMITVCNNDLELLLKKENVPLLTVLWAYVSLYEYLLARQNYASDNATKEKLKSLLREFNQTESAIIKELLGKLQKIYQEDLQQGNSVDEVHKILEDELKSRMSKSQQLIKAILGTLSDAVNEGNALLKKLEASERYKSFTGYGGFRKPLTIETDVWTVAPLRIQNRAELDILNEVINDYAEILEKFILKVNRLTEYGDKTIQGYKKIPLVKPFLNLESRLRKWIQQPKDAK